MKKCIFELIDQGKLTKYAELAVHIGVNVSKKQLVVIKCNVENYVFARLVAKAAYDACASNVVFDWVDDQALKEFYLRATCDYIDNVPRWNEAKYKEWDDEGAAFIHITTENLDLFKDIPEDRVSRFVNASRISLKSHYEKTRSYEVRWCILMIPSIEWALKIYPNLNEEKAVNALWELILKGARADGENPIQDWLDHGKNFESVKKKLDESQYEQLHFLNNKGTDLKIGLPDNHRYLGGGVFDQQGKMFFPNIPTEEIFTAPHKYKVNGKMVASKPLCYAGDIVDQFSLTFKEGCIVDYQAEIGEKTLKNIIETDEGTCYLGEIALVPNSAPISQSNILFYNTLFDENTSCHIGIGNASPLNLKNGRKLTEQELKQAGLNTSLLLVNMTFGTPDMIVTGVKQDGTKELIIKDGRFNGNIFK